MDTAVFLNINKIIERDSKSTTYKFALLRGVIDIIGEASPYITLTEATAKIPLGLLIEKWLIFYYPIFDSLVAIPQINGNAKLAFQNELLAVIDYYKVRGGLSAFYNDLRTRGIGAEVTPTFLKLVKKIGETIVKMPMRYIGGSVNDAHYSIFSYGTLRSPKNAPRLDLEWLIANYDSFAIPIEYYQAFKLLGSFLSGTDSILFKWAEFSVTASGETLTTAKVIEEVVKTPITQRDVAGVKKLYNSILENVGHVECVWTGKQLSTYDVDHVIPFVIWKNNDLWNLLPAQSLVNNQKRHKIPSGSMLESRKDSIVHYWEILKEHQETRFTTEMRLSLLGQSFGLNWQHLAFEQLKRTSDYLINTRCYEAWKP
jgi:hypothetical protein